MKYRMVHHSLYIFSNYTVLTLVVYTCISSRSTCESGRWNCTDDMCDATCMIVGYLNFRSFDGEQFTSYAPPCVDFGFILVKVGQMVVKNLPFYFRYLIVCVYHIRVRYAFNLRKTQK